VFEAQDIADGPMDVPCDVVTVPKSMLKGAQDQHVESASRMINGAGWRRVESVSGARR
jgi:hypothetical protein